jgi:hypothetical protein
MASLLARSAASHRQRRKEPLQLIPPQMEVATAHAGACDFHNHGILRGTRTSTYQGLPTPPHNCSLGLRNIKIKCSPCAENTLHRAEKRPHRHGERNISGQKAPTLSPPTQVNRNRSAEDPGDAPSNTLQDHTPRKQHAVLPSGHCAQRFYS